MISKTEFVNYLVKNLSYTYDEGKNTLINKEGIEVNADSFLSTYKKLSGQSFECIYDDHACCWDILKCTECGTYIFEHYDEDYERNLKCPVCTDYKTEFKYYTKKDIEEDENKKKTIDMYIEFDRMERESEARYEKRGGLYDWERTHIKTILKNKNRKITIQFLGNGIRDLKLDINVWKKENEYGYTWKSKISIPLSFNAFYIQFIYKHLGKCHKDLRSKFYIGKAKECR